jgi:hypothetical protein
MKPRVPFVMSLIRVAQEQATQLEACSQKAPYHSQDASSGYKMPCNSSSERSYSKNSL